MTPLGCTVTRLKPEEVDSILRAVADGRVAVPGSGRLRWLLATCHDGVVWGALREDGFALSSRVFPEVSPAPDRANLLELRLFGPTTELRLWRAADGFDGCRIDEAPQEDLDASPAAPKRESLLLVGDRVVETREGFTLLSGAGGKRQAVPLEIDEDRVEQDLPLRLEVCHHLERDEQTGAVRVALTRWTGISSRGEGNGR